MSTQLSSSFCVNLALSSVSNLMRSNKRKVIAFVYIYISVLTFTYSTIYIYSTENAYFTHEWYFKNSKYIHITFLAENPCDLINKVVCHLILGND